MVSFTVNVEQDRADEFIELLRVHNFTNSTVQCPVFPPVDPRPRPLTAQEEEDLKLFNADGYDGYLEDDMTRITRRQLEKEEAERREAERLAGRDRESPRRQKRPAATRWSSRKKAKAAPVRRQNIPSQDEEVMEEFVILDAGNVGNEGSGHNSDELRSPVRKRRVTVKSEVFTPGKCPLRERLRPRTRIPDKSLRMAVHSSEDSSADHDDQEEYGKKGKIRKVLPLMINCRECGNRAKRSRPRQMYHVMSFHSTERSLKCPHCPFEAARRSSVRLHCGNVHDSNDEPIDIVTDAKRDIWDAMMKKCYPEFADDTGFYKERISTY